MSIDQGCIPFPHATQDCIQLTSCVMCMLTDGSALLDSVIITVFLDNLGPD